MMETTLTSTPETASQPTPAPAICLPLAGRSKGNDADAQKEQVPATQAVREFCIANKLGLHARPAAKFVKTAKRFISDIFVQKENHKVSGKSLFSMLMLAAGHGCKLTVHAIGPDAFQAIAELENLVLNRFGERE
jgi:phosphocarrier protein HPr